MTFSLKITCRLFVTLCLLTPLWCAAQEFGGVTNHLLLPFRVPGSRATYPLSINDSMTITGYYVSNSGVTAGFVREFDGHITTFTVPGSVLTKPVSINPAGDITGYYEVASTTDLIPDVPQGFVRSPDGTITTFGNTANTEFSASFWAQPAGINVAGEVAGNFPSITLSSVAFVRTASGTVSTFTLSDGASYSTVVTGLNAGGSIVGYSSSGPIETAQGFLWDGQGPLPNPSYAGVTQIEVAGSTGTFPTAINAEGTVVGCYATAGGYQDFVRHSDGTITTLKLPGIIPACATGVFQSLGVFNVTPPLISINNLGTMAGYYTNAAQGSSGFVRFAGGEVITVAHPGSKLTVPTHINNWDVITGYYSNGSGTVGFIGLP
jgi:hypothetical protein